MQISGVARSVLSLYRQVLRAARRHDPTTRKHVEAFARAELEKSRGVSKTNVQQIEHLLRKGQRQLSQLQDPAFAQFRWGGTAE
ncbi:hypothetical protein Rsub_13135 [Raphidocelis subcapitata]|uniref:Complex 1 LYR protein domain-containing protein n=1 Tax=Raphidocelis subcapitata TaxID=307507 RepID=A0A2V0PMR2_9CHLO|nr:hypothetical protein Rsub_13135 [Raphidocelis subcapitata]|eukprot:GBG00383.1 hypothetical protein Rsub_13135 [Raphidocelis subcapitata]